MIARTINTIVATLIFMIAIIYILDFSSNTVKTTGKIVDKPTIQKEIQIMSNSSITEQKPEGMEKRLFELINYERKKAGQDELVWDHRVALVAKEHSKNLAEQNKELTERTLLCYLPLVQHEGFDFGLYHYDRLNNRGIYDFGNSGENIFLVSTWDSRKSTYGVNEEFCNQYEQPVGEKEAIAELKKRIAESKEISRVNWTFKNMSQDVLEKSIVDGWMESDSHRKNIINENYTDSGIGVEKVNDFYIVTQVFIQKISCGYNLGPCCVENKITYCYAPMGCIRNTCVKKE